ncbi:MAG: osmoprotectant uptake system substrate-binding protein [Chloroflexi bacterium RBG_16_56_11]|nr:MAG: osmoprotectant uptake system substrate-binding protein [Chloroflexi bacterium RBG_16_56_11]
MKRLTLKLGLLVFLVLAFSGCTGDGEGAPQKGPVTVSSKADTEGSLLGQVITIMLVNNGFRVIDKPAIAGTSLIREALLSGNIDIYPEYTGNGAVFFPDIDPGTWKDARQGYQRVKELDKSRNSVVWLQPAPANNTWAIAIPKSLSDMEGIRSLDDFASYVNRGGFIKLAGSEEFITSQVALPAFEAAYGFSLSKDQLVALAGGNTAQTEKAAAEGTDGVNAAMAYGTDGSLSALDLVVLTDPRGVQPVYQPAPIVRGAVFDKYPELAGILDPVFDSLSLSALQGLNASIAINGQNPAEVARNYLVSKNFLK